MRYDIHEGEGLRGRRFAFGRIVSWNLDVVEHYLLLTYWPGRQLFIAKSTSGLYQIQKAFSISRWPGSTSLHVNLQLHIRWSWWKRGVHDDR